MADIYLAPFSNSDIRDWPVSHYRSLVGALLARVDAGRMVRVVGTGGQRLRAHEIVRPYRADRVSNDCGRSNWTELTMWLQKADCVVGNNSGIAHLSGYLDVPTVCVFGGSHQRQEWRPLGRSVTLITRVIACSPCHLDHRTDSPYGKACLREIDPEVVADAVMATMARMNRLVKSEQIAHYGSSAGVERQL